MGSLREKLIAKATEYRKKESSVNKCGEEQERLQNQLKDIEKRFAKTKAELDDMRRNSDLPILIRSIIGHETSSGDDSISWTTTNLTYYLFDLDAIVSFSSCSTSEPPYPDALDLTTIPTLQGRTDNQIAEEIRVNSSVIINWQNPETWEGLKDAIKEHYERLKNG